MEKTMEQNVFKQVVIVDSGIAEEMETLLSIEEGIAEDYDRDETIHTSSALFVTPYGKFGADIKVCNGDTPYVDPVLFEVVTQNGVNHWYEIGTLGVDETFLGEYHFETKVEVEGVKKRISLIVEVKAASAFDWKEEEVLSLAHVPLEAVEQAIMTLGYEELDKEDKTLTQDDKTLSATVTSFTKFMGTEAEVQLAASGEKVFVQGKLESKGELFLKLLESLSDHEEMEADTLYLKGWNE